MKRRRPQSPVIIEPVEQRTFFSVTTAPPPAEIAPTAGFAARTSDHDISDSSAPDFIQAPFMHQLHGPSDQSLMQSASNVTSMTLGSASTSASSQNLSADSNPVTPSVSVNAPLSNTAISAKDSSPIDQPDSQRFVADWSILNDAEPAVITQQSSTNFEFQPATFDNAPHGSTQNTTAQSDNNDSNDFQALLTYLRQSRADNTDSGMFSAQRVPALREISAGTYSSVANAQFSKIHIHASQAEPVTASVAQQAASAESPSQTMLESLTPNWWVWATSLVVLAAQRLSSKQREQKPKNQFQFLSVDFQPEQIDSKE